MTKFTAEVAKQQMSITVWNMKIVDLNELIICTILQEIFLSELLFIYLFIFRLFGGFLFLTNAIFIKKKR